jgi:hypothetical protein
LIGDEEQAAVVERLVQGSFFSGDFRPERNASTNNTMDFGSLKGVEVGSRICLACVRSEGASFFFVRVLNVVAEVIVAGWVIGKMEVISQWSKIDGCSCAPSSHYYTGHDLGTIMQKKHTTLPSSNKAGPEELAVNIRSGFMLQKRIEFRNSL